MNISRPRAGMGRTFRLAINDPVPLLEEGA
jgi:hypothetical protein